MTVMKLIPKDPMNPEHMGMYAKRIHEILVREISDLQVDEEVAAALRQVQKDAEETIPRLTESLSQEERKEEKGFLLNAQAEERAKLEAERIWLDQTVTELLNCFRRKPIRLK
jgi:hypothetical protein